MSSRSDQKATAREHAAQLRAAQLRAERRRRLLYAGAAVAVVVAVVAGLVIAKVAGVGASKPSAASGVASSPVITDVTSVPAATLDKIGVGSAQGGPQHITAPALTASGKPKVLYVGAEYCPFCAAERWPVVVALSRFGTFANLGVTSSASNDVYPNTPTLSFHGATYNSQYLSFTGVETTSNKLVNGNYAPLDSLTPADQQTFTTYDQPPYAPGQAGSIPFIDIAGKYVSSGATYSPQLLQGLSQAQVAAQLKNPASQIAQAVDGSANLFTAALCQATGNKPGNVCTAPGVTAALARLSKA
jgi:thiol-disulfide isomerase/thioredoxin